MGQVRTDEDQDVSPDRLGASGRSVIRRRTGPTNATLGFGRIGSRPCGATLHDHLDGGFEG